MLTPSAEQVRGEINERGELGISMLEAAPSDGLKANLKQYQVGSWWMMMKGLTEGATPELKDDLVHSMEQVRKWVNDQVSEHDGAAYDAALTKYEGCIGVKACYASSFDALQALADPYLKLVLADIDGGKIFDRAMNSFTKNFSRLPAALAERNVANEVASYKTGEHWSGITLHRVDPELWHLDTR